MRPLIIFTNGCDDTLTDMYFASAVAASLRGYHMPDAQLDAKD